MEYSVISFDSFSLACRAGSRFLSEIFDPTDTHIDAFTQKASSPPQTPQVVQAVAVPILIPPSPPPMVAPPIVASPVVAPSSVAPLPPAPLAPASPKDTITQLKAKAKKGDPAANFKLCQYHLTETPEKPCNRKKAIACFKAAYYGDHPAAHRFRRTIGGSLSNLCEFLHAPAYRYYLLNQNPFEIKKS